MRKRVHNTHPVRTQPRPDGGRPGGESLVRSRSRPVLWNADPCGPPSRRDEPGSQAALTSHPSLTVGPEAATQTSHEPANEALAHGAANPMLRSQQLPRSPASCLVSSEAGVQSLRVEVEDGQEVSQSVYDSLRVHRRIGDGSLRRACDLGACAQHPGDVLSELDVRTGISRQPRRGVRRGRLQFICSRQHGDFVHAGRR